MQKKKNNYSIIKLIVVIFIVVNFWRGVVNLFGHMGSVEEHTYTDSVFSLIASSENEMLDSDIKKFAKKAGIKISIQYDDTLKITRRLNQGEKFDAVWLSNSIWMYAVDSSVVKISDTKSTSINPIIFGIRKSKAEELDFVGRELYTKDIVDAVGSGKLKFSMSNPVATNSGASAYLGILTTLAGNPEVLTQDMLENEGLNEKLKSFFGGVERSSGDEDYLEEMFIQGDYEAVFTYESSIIHINQKLKDNKKEILYALYPVDGVSISDSPIGFIDQKNEKKKEQYEQLTTFLLGNDGQSLLASHGRRTWYGGTTNDADSSVFNPDWGIDTTHYISPLKYPSTDVIRKALALYQSALRKPVHVVFCLDYSGSMWGDRFNQLRDAMDYILTDRAEEDLLQFTGEDIVDVVAFASKVEDIWSAHSEEELLALNVKIGQKEPDGGTALYPAVQSALDLVKDEDRSRYNVSVVVMTDGEGNIGSYDQLRKKYSKIKQDIPIYSIQFASASPSQLELMAELSNGKVFDGNISLVDAFMEVRGYN